MLSPPRTSQDHELDSDPPPGECLDVDERIVVSCAQGVFEPSEPSIVTAEGEVILVGQTIGTVTNNATSVPVVSPFQGWLMRYLAESGERVREGQPLAWLRSLTL